MIITRKISYIMIFFSTFFTFNVIAQNEDYHLIPKKLQAKLDFLREKHGFPGVTFSVVLEDGRAISIASGLADTNKRIPMQPEHRMLAGSHGKTFFIAAALLLEKQDYFRLDDRISKYLQDEPWFHRIPNSSEITIRMLMNHTSGLEEYYLLGDFMKKIKEIPARIFSPQESFSYVFDRPPLFSAGEDWGYADTNYLILGYLLEKISGDNLYQVVQKNFIEPLELLHTEPSDQQYFKKIAVGYSGPHNPFPFHGAIVRNGKLIFNPQFEWTGGGFISNTTDLAIWIKEFYALTKNKQTKKNISPAKTGEHHFYGLGVQIRPSEDLGISYGHSGWFPGYITDAAYFPEQNISLAIQFNTDDQNLMGMPAYSYLVELAKVINEVETK